MSDELERKIPESDEGKDEGEDVEAHRKHGGAGMTDEGDGADEGDDVEAHRQHGGVGRHHGGA